MLDIVACITGAPSVDSFRAGFPLLTVRTLLYCSIVRVPYFYHVLLMMLRKGFGNVMMRLLYGISFVCDDALHTLFRHFDYLLIATKSMYCIFCHPYHLCIYQVGDLKSMRALFRRMGLGSYSTV